jgi:hypothetical protein
MFKAQKVKYIVVSKMSLKQLLFVEEDKNALQFPAKLPEPQIINYL